MLYTLTLFGQLIALTLIFAQAKYNAIGHDVVTLTDNTIFRFSYKILKWINLFSSLRQKEKESIYNIF